MWQFWEIALSKSLAAPVSRCHHLLVSQGFCLFNHLFCFRHLATDSLKLSVNFSSVTQSCPTLCDLMNRSTPGLPVHHQLPELTQTHVHRVGVAIQPSHPLSSPSPPAPNPSQHQGLFQWINSVWGGQSIGVSALASGLPMNTQEWSPLGWTGWTSLQCKGLSRVFSNHSSKASILWRSAFFTVQHTSIHDHWKNHSLD